MSPKPLATAPANPPEHYIEYDPRDAPFWVCERDAERPSRFAAAGPASADKIPSMTVLQSFARAVERHRGAVALRTENMPPLAAGQRPPPALPLAQWKAWTWDEYARDVRLAARGFMALGVEQHDTVSIFGFNSPEWFIGCLGAVHAGAKAAGIYPSDNAEQVQYKAFHSDTAVALVEDNISFDKFKSVLDELPHLKAVVTWAAPDRAAAGDHTRADGSTVRVLDFAALLALGGAETEEEALETRMAAVRPGHCCVLIYTSGTTGRPKAAMLSHDNLNYECLSLMPLANGIGTKRTVEAVLSYLPLSHIAGLMFDLFSPVLFSAFLEAQGCVHFARPYDLKMGTLGQRLVAVEPTAFMGVPRVWEKIAEKLQAIGAQTKGFKKKLSTAAKKRGLEQQMNQQLGGSGRSPSFGPLGIYKKLLAVIKGKLGLSRCKFACAGAAPMSRELLSYFGSLGINVNELYGMSECTAATTISNDAAHEWGTVGFEMPGAEVKVFSVAEDGSKTECPRAQDIFKPTEPEQGEICYRGRHVMLGYLANPKLGDEHVAEIEKKNADAIDEEGWLHSGDKGALSTRGMLKITGRYKELIITAGGENIAPVPIEDAIKARMPFVANAIMVGDKRKFNIVLLTLKCVGATGELPGTNELDGPAKEFGATIQEAVEGGKLAPRIQKALKEIGQDGDVTPSNAARIQKFSILPHDFSVTTGELTASLKLKRSVVEEMHAELIEAMFAAKDAFVPYTVVGNY